VCVRGLLLFVLLIRGSGELGAGSCSDVLEKNPRKEAFGVHVNM
jgi:hypothetical protein